MKINIQEAKAQFSQLLRRAVRGEEIVIARAGKPVARLVPIEKKPRFPMGMDREKLWIADDFDAPMNLV